MSETVKKKRVWLRVLIIVLVTIVVLFAALAGTVAGIWHNEIGTLMSFRQIMERNDAHQDGSVYRMDVSGGFYFDEFLQQGGASSDNDLIGFITNSITKGIIPMQLEESEIACSAFTATTPDGDRIFARNYDFSKTNTCIVFTKPENGRYASISTVDLQFVGADVNKDVTGLMDKISCLAAPYAPLDGINEKGVSCGIFMSYQGEETVATDQKTEKPDITSTTMLRMILDYAATVEEAVALVEKYDLHDSAGTSYHYMIADATGRSAILEWVNGTDITDNDGSARKLVVTYNDDDANIGDREAGADYQWITNFIIQPGYYTSDDEKTGYDRYERIYEELSATDGVVKDESAAMDILAAVGRRNWDNDDKNGCTVHSVVYNLTKKTVLWVSNEHYGEDYATFEFSLAA